ncbi:MAG: hypothetical protein KatS3mg060_1139 [Dehalococcoidia bacterium]|nr:MAG: hypothetical protein KatS3mg060_1139 [Dehalococcoidia bacterium]
MTATYDPRPVGRGHGVLLPDGLDADVIVSDEHWHVTDSLGTHSPLLATPYLRAWRTDGGEVSRGLNLARHLGPALDALTEEAVALLRETTERVAARELATLAIARALAAWVPERDELTRAGAWSRDVAYDAPPPLEVLRRISADAQPPALDIRPVDVARAYRAWLDRVCRLATTIPTGETHSSGTLGVVMHWRPTVVLAAALQRDAEWRAELANFRDRRARRIAIWGMP